MGTLHSRERISIKRESIAIDVGATQSRAGGKHQNRRLAVAANLPRFRDATQPAVVVDQKGNRSARSSFDRLLIISAKIPPLEFTGQVRGTPKNTVAEIGSGNSKTDSPDVFPGQTIIFEKALGPLNPAGNDSAPAQLCIRGALTLGDSKSSNPLHRLLRFLRSLLRCRSRDK